MLLSSGLFLLDFNIDRKFLGLITGKPFADRRSTYHPGKAIDDQRSDQMNGFCLIFAFLDRINPGEMDFIFHWASRISWICFVPSSFSGGKS
jgi:hypothetical protein